MLRRRSWRPPSNSVLRNDPDDVEGALGRRDAGAEREDVGVVVLAREAGGLEVHHRRGADAGDLVGGERHADAGAADQDAAIEFAGRDRAPDLGRVVGIVDRLVRVGAEVAVRRAQLVERVLDQFLQLEAGMVCANRDAHRRGIVL